MSRWERTHELLQRGALELFAERGFDAAGTAQIAERAGVSEMTLFRHFPTKESLLLADPFDPLMADAVRARPPDESAMRALIEGLRDAWSLVELDGAQSMRDRLLLIAQTPALSGAIERNSAGTITALVDALGSRGVDDTRARITVTAVIAGLSTALLEWAQASETSLDDAIRSALDLLGDV